MTENLGPELVEYIPMKLRINLEIIKNMLPNKQLMNFKLDRCIQ